MQIECYTTTSPQHASKLVVATPPSRLHRTTFAGSMNASVSTFRGIEIQMDDNDFQKPKPELVLGQDLATFSVSDIDERIADLQAEIERLKAERNKKANSLSNAEAFFKK